MNFEPLAIVGRACVLPGALNVAKFSENLAAGTDLVTDVPSGRWRLDPEHALGTSGHDQAWSSAGGYVTGFDDTFDPSRFALDADLLRDLDPLFLWSLHTAATALDDAQVEPSERVHVILGNLSFPSEAMTQYGERVWLEHNARALGIDPDELGVGRPHAMNRFSSGMPAHLVSKALGLGDAFALDAACATSLYALQLGADRLWRGDADVVLAGAVNRADSLFLHVGFCALQAMSKSGRSRPFHRDADGLVPAEGAGFVALKRLSDARRDDDEIYGILRGVGLSNDGRGRGFLAPSREGQVRAMRSAYAQNDIDPADVDYVECHATGTSLGDATELDSMRELWPDGLMVGSHKSNFGHAITAAGIAGVLKVLDAFEHGRIAPTLHAEERIAVADDPFHVVRETTDWDGRFAAVNAFGFGGNNAHVVLERPTASDAATGADVALNEEPVALVASWARVGDTDGIDAVFDAWVRGDSIDRRATDVVVDLAGLKFPPKDLDQTLAQQLAVLEGTRRVVDGGALAGADPERTSVFIGIGVDSDIVRYGARWRMGQWGDAIGRGDAWTERAQDAFTEALGAHGVIGSMPNIPANRINSQLDVRGPSFTLSSEELSGVRALEVARDWIRAGRIDAAVVGASEFACDLVHETAIREVADRDDVADAAVVLVLRKLSDAQREGLDVIAVLDDDGSWALDAADVTSTTGRAHAAEGLLSVALGAQACLHAVRPGNDRPAPWIVASPGESRSAQVSVRALGDQHDTIAVRSASARRPSARADRQTIRLAEGTTKDELIANLEQGAFTEALTEQHRVVLVATEATVSERARDAVEMLRLGRTWTNGVYYRDGAIEGELAFVFTGSATAYPGMGAGLITAFPELVDQVGERLGGDLRTISQAQWVYEDGNPSLAQDPERQIWSASWLSQLHVELTRNVFGLRPDAAIGYSLGESSALFGLGAWNDFDAMLEDLPQTALFRDELAGDFAAVRAAWSSAGEIEAATTQGQVWQNWTVLGSVELVQALAEGEELCHVTIINTDDECVLGGHPSGVEHVLLGVLEDPKMHATQLDSHIAVHTTEAAHVADRYRALHHRPVEPVEGVRFYTNATNTHYEISSDACAEAIEGQAVRPIDFRKTIENAWNDGVRIFVEHGPRQRCAGWIQRNLGEREHLVVSLDPTGDDATGHLMNVAAQLIAAGVDVDWRALTDRIVVAPAYQPKHPYAHPAHRPAVRIGIGGDVDIMQPAPARPFENAPAVEVEPPLPSAPKSPATPAPSPQPSRPSPRASNGAQSNGAAPNRAVAPSMPTTQLGGPIGDGLAFQQQVTQMHQAFLQQQAQVHAQFLAMQQDGVRQLTQAYRIRGGAIGSVPTAPAPFVPAPQPVVSPVPPAPAVQTPEPARPEPPQARAPAPAQPEPSQSAREQTAPAEPFFSREDLEYLSHGKISKLYGAEFEPQDQYPVQVRMPMPPLLLADRVMEIDAEPASMKPGRIVTETDVTEESWYLNDGRMPAGVMIESGQADLLLVSYLGIDLLTKGERVYRLLGCQLTYRGELPRPGDTLRYDIKIDGFAKHGDVRLFFFHYDCTVNGEVRLQVRNGQAGFFTYEELEASGGILWTPEEGEYDEAATVHKPTVRCTSSSLSREEIEAFANNRPYDCFGAGWELTQAHLRSPSIEEGDMLFLDRVTDLDYEGGPWGRGYLRAEADIASDDWFFEGHFHNDPCMPGTLMFEAALQAMSIYLAAQGYTIPRDGWRFQPVQDSEYDMRCRGQIGTDSKLAVYEIFIEEIHDGSEDGIPKVFADMLVTVDGLKAFWCRRMGLELVPDYPADRVLEPFDPAARPLANEARVRAIQLGTPSDAFGPMYERFDGVRAVPRLPGPPYDLVTRVREATGQQSMETGSQIVAEYDVPVDAWYFVEGGGEMPYAVLLEAGLQPCGWLASWVGCTLGPDQDVFFRNLDGTATQHRPVTSRDKLLTTTATLTKLSRSGPMTIVGFDVETKSGSDPIFTMQTVFGFFPEEALRSQAGISDDVPALPKVDKKSNIRQERLLGLLQRTHVVDPSGGRYDAGRVVAEMDVDPGHWFFKAHFFSDPVQPGSLGLQLLLDALSLLGEERRPGAAVGGNEHTWKYRGQVRPWNKRVVVDVHRKDDGTADGWLWCDGECIYRFENFDIS